MNKELLLIDAHALIHRFFHALPPLTSPAHEPVGAVYGLAVVLLKVLRERNPAYAAVAFDRPEKTFRAERFEAYKLQRPKAPDALIAQFGRAREAFTKFRIPLFDAAGYEADDVIGTLAARFRNEPNLTIVILSGDKDLLQLVRGDRAIVEMLKSGTSNTVVWNEAAVKTAYGLPPESLPDWKGLVGDASDNIPGVKGIGPKAAAELFKSYGSLEEIYEDIGLIKPALAAKLAANREAAFLSRDLATIQTDVPLAPGALNTLETVPLDRSGLTAFFRELGFMSLVARLAEN